MHARVMHASKYTNVYKKVVVREICALIGKRHQHRPCYFTLWSSPLLCAQTRKETQKSNSAGWRALKQVIKAEKYALHVSFRQRRRT
jgi:hypothetical protein